MKLSLPLFAFALLDLGVVDVVASNNKPALGTPEYSNELAKRQLNNGKAKKAGPAHSGEKKAASAHSGEKKAGGVGPKKVHAASTGNGGGAKQQKPPKPAAGGHGGQKGIRGGNFDTHIVGGQDADLGEYPYFATLNWSGGHFCGASMIASNVALTAAHCGPLANGVDTVIVSAFDRHSTNHDAIETDVIDYIGHPSYDGGTTAYDYAVVKLDGHFCPSSFVSLDTNGGPNMPAADTGLTVIGVGTTSSGGTSPDSLLEVDVDVVEVGRCDELYSANDINEDVMFCAGDVVNGGVDSCQGDSGGPIVKKEQDGSHTQVGVVSWGIGCAWPGYPGVYAKVSYVEPWIRNIACNQWGGTGGICGGSCQGQDVGHEGNGNGDGNGDGNCGNDEKKVTLEFTTDGYGEETSYDITDSEGNVIDSSEGTTYADDTSYTIEKCVDKNTCSTVTLYDSYGDGFCCGGSDPGFTISADGVQLASRTGYPNFGARHSETINGNVGFKLLTDSWGEESVVWVYDVDAGSDIFYRSGFDSNTEYDRMLCVPDGHCIEVSIYDTFGDGLLNDGYFQYYANGQYHDVSITGGSAGPFRINCN